MIKDGIYNLKSLAFAKDFYKFSNRNNFNKDRLGIKIKNIDYDLDSYSINFFPFNKDSYCVRLKHADFLSSYSIGLKHSVFNFYLNKYKISNKYIILNVEDFYLISKYFVKVWNNKNYKDADNLIHLNHDSIFYILKYHEDKLYSLEEFKGNKLDDIFNRDLVYQLKQF